MIKNEKTVSDSINEGQQQLLDVMRNIEQSIRERDSWLAKERSYHKFVSRDRYHVYKGVDRKDAAAQKRAKNMCEQAIARTNTLNIKKKSLEEKLEELHQLQQLNELKQKKVIKMVGDNTKDKIILSHTKELDHIENIVFQGGGVKGFAYIGALQELAAHYIEFNNIQRTCGTSAGALTALLVGLNYSLEQESDHESELFGAMNDMDLINLLDNENGFGDLFLILKKYFEQKITNKKYEDLAKEIGLLIVSYVANKLSQRVKTDTKFMEMIRDRFEQLQKTVFYKGTKGLIKGILGKRIANAITPKDLLAQSPIGLGTKDVQQILDFIADAARSNIQDSDIINLLKKNPQLEKSLNETIDKLIEQFTTHYGLFSGENLRRWVDQLIERKTDVVRSTFKELHQFKIDNPHLNIKDIYFVAFDVSIGMPIIFSYEHTPTAIVSDAAMASMSIPLFFEPREIYVKDNEGQRISISSISEQGKDRHHRIWEYRQHLFVDGGISENYPLWVFDSPSYIEGSKTNDPMIPVYNKETLGLRLVSSELMKEAMDDKRPETIITNFGSYLYLLGQSFFSQQEGGYLQRADRKRTLYLDSLDIDATMFDLTDPQKEKLIESGRKGISSSILKITEKENDCLLLAAQKNNEALAVIALQAKAKPTAIDTKVFHHGWNALHWAAYHGNNVILSMILDVPENLSYIDRKTSPAWSKLWLLGLYKCAGQQTPMELAQQRGHTHTIELLEHYASVITENVEQAKDSKQAVLKK